MIQLNELYTGYNKNNPLLQDINYRFENKIYGILGESGCGKTTLLKTIAGLIKPLSGNVEVNGIVISKPDKNNVYMMHQNYTCFDWKDCLGNVLISKQIKGSISDEDIEYAIEMLKKVKLSEHIDKYPKQLSGGMRQRLALARTLFMKPEIILMDEPLSALDGKTREEMQELILDLHKEINNTIIMVTHSFDEAVKMCDTIIKFKGGSEHGIDEINQRCTS